MLMDEDEVQNWYEEEKQRLFDMYTKDLEDGKDRQVSEKKFHTKMESVMKQFNEKMDKAIKSKERQIRMQQKFDALKERLHLGKKHEKNP